MSALALGRWTIGNQLQDLMTGMHVTWPPGPVKGFSLGSESIPPGDSGLWVMGFASCLLWLAWMKPSHHDGMVGCCAPGPGWLAENAPIIFHATLLAIFDWPGDVGAVDSHLSRLTIKLTRRYYHSVNGAFQSLPSNLNIAWTVCPFASADQVGHRPKWFSGLNILNEDLCMSSFKFSEADWKEIRKCLNSSRK
jgi:hypothetical protein